MIEFHCNADWYHGSLSRDDCERLLNPRQAGKFLVRDSHATRGCFVLSVCAPAAGGKIGIENYLVKPIFNDSRVKLTIDEHTFFSDLEELVSYYKRSRATLACQLKTPVCHQPKLEARRTLEDDSKRNSNLRKQATSSRCETVDDPWSPSVSAGGALWSSSRPSGRLSPFSTVSISSGGSTGSNAAYQSVDSSQTSNPSPYFNEPRSAQKTSAVEPNCFEDSEVYESGNAGLTPTAKLLASLQTALTTFDRDGWLIEPNELLLNSARSLGGGEFGEVLRGELRKVPSLRQYSVTNRRTDHGTIVVAVKKLKTCVKLAEFYSEALLLTDLHHANLVRLIGVVHSPVESDGDETQSSLAAMNILIVTEFCALGDLVNYLRSRGRSQVTATEQLRFASEVCAAMRFLESQRIVHRDLAARNVLLDEDAHCKVSDFGLARFLRRDGAAVLAGGDLFAGSVDENHSKFPVKWTAPEAIRDALYSMKSDVWSYGVLLWEIYSFGLTPYRRLQLGEVLPFLDRGMRMECPSGCPADVYNLMLLCWSQSAADRPTFARLFTMLSALSAKMQAGHV